MALSPEQLQQIKSSFDKQEEVKESEFEGMSKVIANMSTKRQPKSTFLGRAKEALKQRGGEFKETFGKSASGEINPIEAGIRYAGDIAGGVGDVVGAALQPAVQKLAQTDVGREVFEVLGKGMDKYEEWKNKDEKNERIGEIVESVFNIADLAGVAAAGKITTKAGLRGVKGLGKAKNAFVSRLDSLTAKKPAVAEIASKKVKNLSESLKGVKQRIKLNAEEAKEATEAFNALPKSQQNAMRLGILDRDAALIDALDEGTKAKARELVKVADEFAENRKATPPSAVVGAEARNIIEKLNERVQNVGSQLGDFAGNIQPSGLPDVETSVLQRLRQVPGMQGLKIVDGQIDFSDTTLAGAKSAAARKSITQSLDDVLKVSGNAKRAHLLRQELFEELGGKRKAGVVLTATEDKALEAMRKGLADALEEANDGYKQLSQQYAQLKSQEQALKKRFGEVAEGNEDIFDVKAGILMRRLSSNAKTGQEILQDLRETQRILRDYGIEFDVNFEDLQEVANIVNRYFDIAPDNSLAGILRDETATIPLGRYAMMAKVIENVFGESIEATDATRRAAVKQLLGITE